MAAGNKKKKKPAANPARGFATTSIQSKSRTDQTPGDSADVSGVATPATKSETPIDPGEGGTKASDVLSKRELHELSPEELESQLESAELQQIVEKHAAKVRKEASRQASRLQTEKRLLRNSADFLSLRGWLPDELMLEIYELTLASTHDMKQSDLRPGAGTGDDLIAKVWTLRNVLVDLGISVRQSERSNLASFTTSRRRYSRSDMGFGICFGLACHPLSAWRVV